MVSGEGITMVVADEDDKELTLISVTRTHEQLGESRGRHHPGAPGQPEYHWLARCCWYSTGSQDVLPVCCCFLVVSAVLLSQLHLYPRVICVVI